MVVVGVVLGLVVVVVVVVVVEGAQVAVVMVVVLWVRPQETLAFGWGMGAGHRLQPLSLHDLIDSGAGLGWA